MSTPVLSTDERPVPRSPLRVLPIPESAPTPLPDEAFDLHAADPPRSEQAVLELAFPGSAPTAPRSPALGSTDELNFGPQPTPTADLPDPDGWSARMAVALVEVVTGGRSAAQLMRWLAPAVHDSLVRRQSRTIRRGTALRRPVRVRRVRATHPRDGVVEATVVLLDGSRIRAVALRLEGLDRRWVVTAAQLG